MRWWRSEEMCLVNIIMNEDAAHSCIHKLGALGTVQFQDLNPSLTPFQRRYVGSVKRCDEMERILRFFDEELAKFGITPKKAEDAESFMAGMDERQEFAPQTASHVLEKLESVLQAKENELRQLDTFRDQLSREHNERIEFNEVLSKTLQFFKEFSNDNDSGPIGDTLAASAAPINAMAPPINYGTRHEALKFAMLTGVVETDIRAKFERMVFRVTRGNCFIRFDSIDELIVDPDTGNKVQKDVFSIFYKSETIERKLKKICDAFKAKAYELESQRPADITRKIMQNEEELKESSEVLRRNRDSCIHICDDIAYRQHTWRRLVRHEKIIYHTLNLCKADVSGMLQGDAWVVKENLPDVERLVADAHGGEQSGQSMPCVVNMLPRPWPEPPTYFKLDEVTVAFQSLVDTYGIPRYQEINPAVYTLTTFPFLFGVMFGDVGHGSCLLVFGIYLVATGGNSSKIDQGELMNGLYMGRYMIFLMGVFAVYCGLIYNEFFAVSLNLFGSHWHWRTAKECSDAGLTATQCLEAIPVKGQDPNKGDVYSFGIDPAWHISENDLLFYNSFKMKISVIMGITQMLTGTVLKGFNAIHTREVLDFMFEVIPMLVFAVSLFGYMIVLIMLKWSINWDERMGMATGEDGKPIKCPLNYGGTGNGCQPPGLINTLMEIALKPGYCSEPMFAGQAGLQSFLLTCAFISVPVLLLAKPLILKMRHDNRKKGRSYSTIGGHKDDLEDSDAGTEDGDDDGGHGGGHGHGHGPFNFSEIMIHQMIETIEFVLGMVSNTASYLRLWALSLAHSELALVFWEKVFESGLATGDPVAIFVAYAIWMGVTFAVLLCMDVLECFLHALRLHWVEFQNKFYKADGYAFAPLDFKKAFRELDMGKKN